MAAVSKGSLSLLLEYDDEDSSDEEVPGPKVSTKRVLKNDGSGVARKNLKTSESNGRLPLPVGISSLFSSSSPAHVDDPNLHDGRVRSFPHERGNWSTYVFVPYVPSLVINSLSDVLVALMEPEVLLKRVEDLHVSVTRTVILRHHWIDPFVDSVQKSLIGFPSFSLGFGNLEVFTNEEKTRTFIGFTVDIGGDKLSRITQEMDKCLEDFKLPPFYSNPAFHLSIVWCLGDKTKEIKERMPSVELVHQQFLKAHPSEWHTEINQVDCKCGNKLYSFPLVQDV
ncbi:U6 snRNA phosphodiesterase [Ischnura elegans]|uniref:U6 snRNA phosphodiesterase n=1 Tax=Ischnura elegans TaxID=197161 RepID=UPI001ED8A3A0|nr:U6 snRNA phosphodiesterase [Ischnura elegans]